MKTVSQYLHVHSNNKSGFAYVSQRWESRRVADFLKMASSVYKVDVASDTEKTLHLQFFNCQKGSTLLFEVQLWRKCIKKNLISSFPSQNISPCGHYDSVPVTKTVM